jgi:TPR repeat protein
VALNTDFDWLREHTRYLQRATEWDRGGRPANRLLSGDDIAEAKAWAARRPKSAPEPTPLHLNFIRASEEEAEARSSAQRKQLEEMAAAQAERETALHEAEEAQRKRATMARIRNIALVAVSILFLLAGWLGWRSEQQRKVAEEQKQQADLTLAGVANITTQLHAQMDEDTKKKVFAVFQTGADHGHTISMGFLGLFYSEGFGVAQDYAKSREWYEKAAAKDNANAMYELGQIYSEGFGVARDYAKAREWFEKAAAKDNSNAMFELGVLYSNGQDSNGQGLPQDYAKAREWFEKAASGTTQSRIVEGGAMWNLGFLYANGLGVARDYAMAREWYEKAADKGDANAMFELGVLYSNGQDSNGQGVPQDYAKAREWFEKAADKDNSGAMFYLGVLYADGLGVAQDYSKAREWYEKAADKGHAGAMSNLGVFYGNGQGVAQDYTKAREWFEKAAEKDDTNAMGNLGLLYENGDGVAKDHAKAREWYEKAADKGHAGAKAQLEQLPISEAVGAGRYAEALQLQEVLTAKVEEVETKREGKPGEETAQALGEVAERALFTREFARALSAAKRAHALLPGNLTIEAKRVHALMFLGQHEEESKALYLAHKGQPIPDRKGKPWERAIAEDFAEFRKAGLTHPMMAEIEKELGVSP